VKTKPPTGKGKKLEEDQLPLPGVQGATTSRSVNDEPPEADGSERVAVSVYFDKEGNLQFDRTREKSKQQLRELFGNAQLRKALGLEDDKAKPAPVEFFDPEWTSQIYDGLGQFEVMLAQKMGISPEIARQVFPYTADEKRILQKPTTTVINKYANAWIVQFKDEIALIGLLVSIAATKVSYARQLMEAQAKINQPQAAPSRTIPIRPDVPADAAPQT
jgi:hypothetical protein